MRGRKPKPPEIKQVTRSQHVRPNAPVPKGYLYQPPDWMTADQKQEWDQAIADAPHGLLKRLDKNILAAWVVACCLHREAAIQVSKLGMLVKSPVKGEPMQSPYLAILNKQSLLMVRTAAELGFTPSSRSRVDVPNNVAPESLLGEFLNEPLH
jgi:P27 family predicted phage terminase small subunit